MKDLIFISRMVLSAILVYFSYTETGVWTALCLLLIMGSLEGLVILIRKAIRADIKLRLRGK